MLVAPPSEGIDSGSLQLYCGGIDTGSLPIRILIFSTGKPIAPCPLCSVSSQARNVLAVVYSNFESIKTHIF